MYRIKGLMSDSDLAELDRLLERGKFSSGLGTAGGAGQTIKNNVQLEGSDPNGPAANQLVHKVLMSSEAFKEYAMPYKVSDITFSRYTKGMSYGDHTDNPVNWSPRQVIRSDLSFTIFLSERDEYEGGELVAAVLGEEVSVKYDRGDMVIYPSGTMHRVGEVTDGCRKVAIGWLQSLVRDQQHREIIHAIYKVRNDILVNEGRTDNFRSLDFACTNLQRLWAQV